MSWSINAEGKLSEVIQTLDLHRMSGLIGEEAERQYERVKQMALAELRSYPAVFGNGSYDGVRVILAGHRVEEGFGSVTMSVYPIQLKAPLAETPKEAQTGGPVEKDVKGEEIAETKGEGSPVIVPVTEPAAAADPVTEVSPS